MSYGGREREQERAKHRQNGSFMNRVGRVRFVSQCAASWWNITLELLCKPPPQPRCFYVSANRETVRAWHHYFTLIPVQSTTRSLCFRALTPVSFTHPTHTHADTSTHTTCWRAFDAIRRTSISISCALLSSRIHSHVLSLSVLASILRSFCLDFHQYMVAMTTGPFMKAL